jgi:hypothetical protein
MRNFNLLVKMIFYKHKEHNATANNTKDTPRCLYNVGYIDQLHANLCTAASENMLYHFSGRPVATMVRNPRGVMEGAEPNESNFNTIQIDIKDSAQLQQALNDKGPFILSLPLKYGCGHSVVAIGYAGDNIIYHDPLTGSNKMLSISELQRISDGSSIEIAVPNPPHLPEYLRSKQIDSLNEHPIDIPIKKYAHFFTLDKMADESAQCNAIKNFLMDYTRNSFWTKRTHKAAVESFLKEHKNTHDLRTLLSGLTSELGCVADKNRGELWERLNIINQACNYDTSDATNTEVMTHVNDTTRAMKP